MLVPPDDGPALADGVSALLADPVRAAALGRAGYARLVERFPVERMIHATTDVYADVVRSGARREPIAT